MDQANNKLKSARLLSIVIAVIATIGWYLYFDQRQQQRALNEDLSTTREELEIEIQSLNQNLIDSKADNRELSELNELLKADVAASLVEKSVLQQQMQQELEGAIAANRELQLELETAAADALGQANTRHQALAALESLEIIAKVGSEGKLFGSIGTVDIADAITAAGVTVEKREVRLPDGAIRTTGEHQIDIHLYTEVDASVTISIVGEE